MKRSLSSLFAVLVFCALAWAGQKPTVAEAQAFIIKAQAELLNLASVEQGTAWVEETFITLDTEKLASQAQERLIARTTELVNESKKFQGLRMPADLKRQFELLKLSLTLPAPGDPKLRRELTDIATSLEGSYGSGKYCAGDDQSKCLGVDELGVQMAQSRIRKNWNRSGRAGTKWALRCGTAMRVSSNSRIKAHES